MGKSRRHTEKNLHELPKKAREIKKPATRERADGPLVLVLLHKHHFLCFGEIACLKFIEINSR